MKSLPETRYTLIGRLHDPQDAEAWSEFTSIYQPVIFRFCRAKGLQHADATDVTQDVLAKIVSAIEKFDLSRKKKNFRGWLYRITRNLVVDFVRKRNGDPTVQFEVAIEIGEAITASENDSAEFQKAYQQQIFLIASQQIRATVKPQTWTAFWDTEVNRKPIETVSGELNMSAGAIYVSRSRVLARIKSKVEEILKSTSGYLSEQDAKHESMHESKQVGPPESDPHSGEPR